MPRTLLPPRLLRVAAVPSLGALLLAIACSGGGDGADDRALVGAPSAIGSDGEFAGDRAQATAVTAMRRPATQAEAARGAAGAAALSASATDAAQPDAIGFASRFAVSDPSTMIIRTGTAAVEVGDLDAALRELARLAVNLGGSVANTVVQSGREQVPTATVELRLPPARYDDALGGLSPLGTVEAVNVTAEDVGEEYTDLAARAANGRRLEERLLQLLATRTGKLDDVLMVERELARVREDIERIEGRLRYLRARTATSTLAVTLHEPPPITGSAPGGSPIADAFREAWSNLVAVVAFAIAAAGAVLPLAALGLVGWIVVRRLLPRIDGGAARRGAAGPA